MNEILVSISCITFNHEKYIADAIDSFLMQKTNFKYEILIHDDASTDRTAEIIMQYESLYPDLIKPIYQKENQYSKGVLVEYFNHERAQGKYIAICEGDDFWTDPYKLQKQTDYMEKHPECSMCFHAAELVKAHKGKIGIIKPYNQNCISSTEDIILGGGGFMATNSILYRKITMDYIPDFYLSCPVGDYPLQILSSTKDYAYYINEFMSARRVAVKGSWTSRMNQGKNAEESFVDFQKQLIDMLNGFNDYSGGKFFNAVNRKILNTEFEILKAERKLKQLKVPKYKLFYDSLGIKGKVKVYASCYFPLISRKLSQFIRYLKQYKNDLGDLKCNKVPLKIKL